ncbi:hypothetical protein ACNF49_38865 [Actinomadura sp. ATCC 39365]
MAIVFSGLTASTVLGAAIGQALGWRFTFWTLVVFGAVALLGLIGSLGRRDTADVRHEHHHDARPGAEFDGLDAHARAHLGGAGQGPTMREQLADRAVMPTVLATLGALAVALFAMTFAIESRPATVVMMLVFGTAAFAVVAPLQLRVMTAAGQAPDVASAANISVFTLGSAIGIHLGGAAIDGGLGLSSVNWVGGLLTTAGLLTALATWRLADQRPPVPAGHHHHAPPAAHRH